MNQSLTPGNGVASRQGMAKAGGSALAARVIAQGAQLFLFIVAARVLIPADFGLFALVQASSALLFLFAAAGWREFIMGWGGDARAINQAITLSLFSGYVMTAIGVTAAAIMVLVFNAPLLAMLSLIFSACVFLAPLTNAIGAILVRNERVPALSIAMIIAELAGLAAGIWGLLSGWGILALGASKLVMQAVNLGGVMLVARWPIRLILHGGYGAQIIEISRQIMANRVISFVANNASIFIVGGFLGVTNVGLFRAAERVVSSIAELVFEPLRLIAWMVFRKAADSAQTETGVREELTKEAGIFLPLLIVFASPIFIGLSVVSEELITVLLGEVWAPAAPVVTILAISALLIAPSITNEPLLTMTGKIRALAPVALFNAFVAVVVLLAFARFGLVAAALARLGASAVVTITSIWLQSRHANAPWWGTIKRAAPVYTALIALIASVLGARVLLGDQNVPLANQLLIEIGIGAAVYFTVIMIIKPAYLRTVLWL